MRREVVLPKFSESLGSNAKVVEFYVFNGAEDSNVSVSEIADALHIICSSCHLNPMCRRMKQGFSDHALVFTGTETRNVDCGIPRNSKGGLVLNLNLY